MERSTPGGTLGGGTRTQGKKASAVVGSSTHETLETKFTNFGNIIAL